MMIHKKDTTRRRSAAAPLVEGVDFYWEGNLFVFTEEYHLKRGYCCGSGCRHCPFPKPPEENEASRMDTKNKE